MTKIATSRFAKSLDRRQKIQRDRLFLASQPPPELARLKSENWGSSGDEPDIHRWDIPRERRKCDPVRRYPGVAG
jgi:hypothetical protein